MKIIKIKPAACNCNAYAFPHRSGGGSCIAPGDEPKSCRDCKYSSSESDPYGTGDKNFYQADCALDFCLWGK